MGGAEGGKAIGRLTPKMAQRPRASDAARRFVAGDGRARESDSQLTAGWPAACVAARGQVARVANIPAHRAARISQHRAHSCPQESLYLSACPA
jgi:hypothetical protein